VKQYQAHCFIHESHSARALRGAAAAAIAAASAATRRRLLLLLAVVNVRRRVVVVGSLLGVEHHAMYFTDAPCTRTCPCCCLRTREGVRLASRLALVLDGIFLRRCCA
jgi:hypothetical protein